MNLWDRLKYAIAMKQLGIGQTVLPWKDNMPQYPKDNFHDYVENGFSRNELVYACIMELSRAVPEAPLRVYDTTDDMPIENHPLRELMKRPNAFTTEFVLWEMTIIYLMIHGNAYWEKVRSRGGQVVEIVQLRPDRVRPVPSSEDYISRYEYEIGGRTFDIPAEDIVHFKMPSPDDEFLGQPPLRSALRAVATDNEATDFTKVMLQNSAIPGVVITTQNAIDEDTVKRLTRKWMQRFGSNQRGKPAFLQEGMKVEQMGMTLKDLEFPELRAISETRICAVFGVPPILVGANTGLNRSTFSNYEEARRSFWQETISPLLRKLADQINKDLVPEWNGTNIEASFDSTNVTALQSLTNEKYTRANESIVNGWITVNEARTSVGLEPVDNGDIFLRTLQQVGVPSDGGEPTLPPQPEPTGGEAEPGAATNGAMEPAMQNAKKKEVKPIRETTQKQFELLERAFGKINFALEIEKDLRAWARREFARQAREIRASFNRTTKQLDQNELEQILADNQTAQRAWETRISTDVYPIMDSLISNAISQAGDELGIAFELSNEDAQRFIRQYSFRFAQKISETSANDVRNIMLKGQAESLSLDEIRTALSTKFAEWGSIRVNAVARSEVIRSSNMGARFTYQQAGVEQMEWVASSDACPYCESLDGTVVSTNGDFLQVGGEVQPAAGREAEATRPYTNNYEDVLSPPLHPNCRCTIIPIVQ